MPAYAGKGISGKRLSATVTHECPLFVELKPIRRAIAKDSTSSQRHCSTLFPETEEWNYSIIPRTEYKVGNREIRKEERSKEHISIWCFHIHPGRHRGVAMVCSGSKIIDAPSVYRVIVSM